ncbi:hypothetical protein HYPSUDRAFT_543193 [Hypholoma sublateritium FD-334 SS-4]|uniref:Uncharacterized protein n=1 Tax=Hypholoma sublateritium (strain FD-334 SS-4) TaxID=945553 RepID=A0A0D2KGD9_HYPSF|nr:hypothetical protein HYPSUDRAFT_543193 [Hypholoma sublateritium FD-334 SS-4]
MTTCHATRLLLSAIGHDLHCWRSWNMSQQSSSPFAPCAATASGAARNVPSSAIHKIALRRPYRPRLQPSVRATCSPYLPSSSSSCGYSLPPTYQKRPMPRPASSRLSSRLLKPHDRRADPGPTMPLSEEDVAARRSARSDGHRVRCNALCVPLSPPPCTGAIARCMCPCTIVADTNRVNARRTSSVPPARVMSSVDVHVTSKHAACGGDGAYAPAPGLSPCPPGVYIPYSIRRSTCSALRHGCTNLCNENYIQFELFPRLGACHAASAVPFTCAGVKHSLRIDTSPIHPSGCRASRHADDYVRVRFAICISSRYGFCPDQ